MGGKRWTTEEEDAIVRYFPLQGKHPAGAQLRKLSKILDRTPKAIAMHWHYMSRGAIKASPSHAWRLWTPAQDEMLVDAYPLEGESPNASDEKAKELVKLLNRTYSAIASRWWRLERQAREKTPAKRARVASPEAEEGATIAAHLGRCLVQVLDIFTIAEKLRAESPAFRDQLSEIAVIMAQREGKITGENEAKARLAIRQLLAL